MYLILSFLKEKYNTVIDLRSQLWTATQQEIHIVTPEWLQDCIREKRRMDEKSYEPRPLSIAHHPIPTDESSYVDTVQHESLQSSARQHHAPDHLPIQEEQNRKTSQDSSSSSTNTVPLYSSIIISDTMPQQSIHLPSKTQVTWSIRSSNLPLKAPILQTYNRPPVPPVPQRQQQARTPLSGPSTPNNNPKFLKGLNIYMITKGEDGQEIKFVPTLNDWEFWKQKVRGTGGSMFCIIYTYI